MGTRRTREKRERTCLRCHENLFAPSITRLPQQVIWCEKYRGVSPSRAPFYVEPILLSSSCYEGYAQSLVTIASHTLVLWASSRGDGTRDQAKTEVRSTLVTSCLVGVFIACSLHQRLFLDCGGNLRGRPKAEATLKDGSESVTAQRLRKRFHPAGK